MSTKKILQDITEVVVDAVVWVEVVSRIEVAVIVVMAADSEVVDVVVVIEECFKLGVLWPKVVGYPDLALQA